MMELLEELRAALPRVEFCYDRTGLGADALLILNACQVQCASRPPFSGPVVVVAPDSIDHWPVPPGGLCGALASRLGDLLSGG